VSQSRRARRIASGRDGFGSGGHSLAFDVDAVFANADLHAVRLLSVLIGHVAQNGHNHDQGTDDEIKHVAVHFDPLIEAGMRGGV
jgi:hypothetical protein